MEPVDVQHLEAGKTYVISREILLVPVRSPSSFLELIEAASKLRRIPKGDRFTVHNIDLSGKRPWYHVTTLGQGGEETGTGWIDSAALLGQSLVCEKKEVMDATD